MGDSDGRGGSHVLGLHDQGMKTSVKSEVQGKTADEEGTKGGTAHLEILRSDVESIKEAGERIAGL
jgi:hypothetical protein